MCLIIHPIIQLYIDPSDYESIHSSIQLSFHPTLPLLYYCLCRSIYLFNHYSPIHSIIYLSDYQCINSSVHPSSCLIHPLLQFINVNLSVLSIHRIISLSIHPPIYLLIYISIGPSICTSIHPNIRLFIHPITHLSNYLKIHPRFRVYPSSTHLSAYLYINRSIQLYINPFKCLSIQSSIYPIICKSIQFSKCLSSIHPPIYLLIHISIAPSISASIHPNI